MNEYVRAALQQNIDYLEQRQAQREGELAELEERRQRIAVAFEETAAHLAALLEALAADPVST
jgi:predicted  nucleic acid-binding Zn-ribbon protein